MVYEDLDAGDETRRNGDYVSYPHADSDGTALDSVSIPRGSLVAFDGTDLQEVTDVSGSGLDIAGVLANYDVSGDTGKEVVGPKANVKVRGEVIADLGGFSPAEGEYLDSGDNSDVYVVEQVDGDLYRVQVR